MQQNRSANSSYCSNQWAAKIGDERWSWAGLLPYFKKSETFYPTPDQESIDVSAAHGFDGPIKVFEVFPSSQIRILMMSRYLTRQIQENHASTLCENPFQRHTNQSVSRRLQITMQVVFWDMQKFRRIHSMVKDTGLQITTSSRRMLQHGQ